MGNSARYCICGLFILALAEVMAIEHPFLSTDTVPQSRYYTDHFNLEYYLPEGTEEERMAWLEELEWLGKNPLNINSSTAEELRNLPFLNELLIGRLLDHIQSRGPLISIYELQSIDGFTPVLIQTIRPFVYLDRNEHRPVFGFGTLAGEGEHLLLLRYQQLVETQTGFIQNEYGETAYPGCPCRLYVRYRYTWYRHISVGFTAEKDPGEEFFRGSQPRGFDFYSAHLFVRDIGRLKALALGDFLVQWGQGLTLWKGMGFGKSSHTMGIRKNGVGLRQYTSVDENNFFRGIGLTWQAGPVEITMFYSPKKRDANIVETEEGKRMITSFPQTGLHRTPRELEGKNAVKETSSGVRLAGFLGPVHLGVTVVNTHWDTHIQKPSQPSRQFSIDGHKHLHFGVDYEWSIRNLALFGEWSGNKNLHPSFINGLLIGLHPRASLALLHRNYHIQYKAVSAAVFGEHSRGENERGLYAGLELHLSPAFIVSAYADHFRFPWLRYRANLPSEGFDYLIHASYKPDRQTDIYFRFRLQSKPLNETNPDRVVSLEENQRIQFRLHVSKDVLRGLRLNNRLEYVQHTNGKERTKGFLVYQDILYRPPQTATAITFRYALFSTDGHDSRIYAHEHDVLYAFGFPFYSDRGYRFYVLIRYPLARQLDLYARFARTSYINRDSTGSGTERIEGNHRSEIKLQFRFRF